MIKPLWFKDNDVYIIDQTLLPREYREIRINDHLEMAEAIRSLRIRGAPAIGIAAAYGIYLGLRSSPVRSCSEMPDRFRDVTGVLASTRPTAVNLAWAINRIKAILEQNDDRNPANLLNKILEEAGRIHTEDIAMCRNIASNGAPLLPDEGGVLTHCNAGGLATGGIGTALGIIIHAFKSGKRIHVYADETRPLLQGARLTMWELEQNNVPATLITDNTATFAMSRGMIRSVVVGADRIANNGDTANKIGTLNVAVSARYYDIPFYVAAPTSTIDTGIETGSGIPIEERSGAEVSSCGGAQIAPDNSRIFAPAFDVTPASLITAIITEKGIHHPPFNFSQEQ